MNTSALGPFQPVHTRPTHYNTTTTAATAASGVHGCLGPHAAHYPQHLPAVYPAPSIVPSNACPGFDGRLASLSAPPAEPVVTFSNPWAHDASRSSMVARSQSGSVSLTCVHPEVPAELRRNPRRVAAPVRAEVPPMANQAHRKVGFVDKIVASATEIVKAIWPRSWTVETGSTLPLRTFIQETLRRSRTSFSTLQVALYYLILIRPVIAQRDPAKERTLGCGRRMFLSALILASKYLQDRNYSARAWAKISGLSVTEINQNEIAFLIAIDWRLYVAQDVFEQWTRIVGTHAPSTMPPSATAVSHAYFVEHARWRKIILGITPQLDNLESLLDVDDAAWQSVAGPISPPQTPEPSMCVPRAAVAAAAAAVAAAPSRGSAMAMAVAQHNSTVMRSGSARSPTALGASVTPPPDLVRRPSVASYAPSTYSVASSPESMVSDVSEVSRSSRSSSISSSSSLPGAQPNLSVQARIRQAMQCDKAAAATERFGETAIMSSPESFVLSAAAAAAAPYSYGSDVAAARALAELQHNRHDYAMPVPKPSLKRCRRMSGEDAVESGFACPKYVVGPSHRKRARVDTVVESATFVQLTPAVAVAPQGPGMWAGIL
jgi:hypothetical protein